MTLTPQEQSELLGEITTTLVGAVPPGWRRLIFDFMVVGKHVNVAFGARLSDGSTRQVQVPREISEPISRLRNGMYAEGLGTWYSLDLVIDPPDTYKARFNRDAEPPFRTPPAPEQYALDLEWFPRTEENLPEWFRANL